MAHSSEQFSGSEKEKTISDNIETFQVGENFYYQALVVPYAEQLPVIDAPLNELRGAVAEGNYYWDDENGEKLGPHQILRDWEAAKNNPAWRHHVASIEKADLKDPIWVMKDGLVFDGMHRLTRAFHENHQTIKARMFEAVPDFAMIKGVAPDKDINAQLRERAKE